jgi:hypothetical protein
MALPLVVLLQHAMQGPHSPSAPPVAGLERVAFWLTVLLAGATFWIAPRPPMADLPQHAGQIALWRDLLRGTSNWQSLVQVNYFTPYLTGSSLALLLSFLMPVAAALKLLLALSYYAFVAACVLLRRWMGSDRRLDWLFITGFFGLAYEYGIFPFLIALPIGMVFVALAHRHAERPSPALAAMLCFTGAALFFSHGLVFVFAAIIGVALLLLRRRSGGPLLASAIPYWVLGLLCLVYVLLGLPDAGSTSAEQAIPVWPGLFSGLKHLIFFPIGAPSLDWLCAPLVPLLLCAPLVLGCHVNWQNKPAFVPIAVLLLWFALVPESFRETWFIGSRFAVFLLPFYALLFSAPGPARARTSWVRLGIPALCWVFLAIHVDRLTDFAREAQSFDDVLAATVPGHRALGLVLDITSPAAQNPMAYVSFPVWYQAEKSGFVDFNFAYFPTQVVRYRDGKKPSGDYRYFFVRSTGPLPAKLFPAGACEPVLRKSSGSWSVYENGKC